MSNTVNLIPPPFKVGNIEVQQVVEMQSPLFAANEFLPTADKETLESLRPQFEPWAICPATGKLVLAIQTYILRTTRHTILVDTCVGCDKVSGIAPWHMRNDRRWLQRLASVGVSVDSVDYVFCTHLHGDHIGWNTQLIDGRYVPTFPKARYVFSKKEIEWQADITDENRKTAYQQSVVPVIEAGQAQIVESDFALDDEVWLVPTPGHTPGHVAVHVKSAGVEAVLVGDVIHSPIQCAHPQWVAMPDSDPAMAAKTRRSVLENCLAENHLVLTSHFPLPSVGRVTAAGSDFGFTFQT